MRDKKPFFPIRQRTETLEVYCRRDRKSTRLNSSHLVISYAVFCLKKKPDIDLDDIDVSVKFFRKRLAAPVIISSITGGLGVVGEINATIAKVAAVVGVAMGVRSER